MRVMRVIRVGVIYGISDSRVLGCTNGTDEGRLDGITDSWLIGSADRWLRGGQ